MQILHQSKQKMTQSQNKTNYIELMKKMHQHPETKQWFDQELRHPNERIDEYIQSQKEENPAETPTVESLVSEAIREEIPENIPVENPENIGAPIDDRTEEQKWNGITTGKTPV